VADAAWGGLLRQVRGELGVRRPVALVVGGDRAMPMTWGWRRPVILLPAGAEAWPEARRRAVLLHELAHGAPQDYPAQLAAEAVRALYWFNPRVWMAPRRLRIESEHACDDQVLAAGARPSDYAGDPLDIARSLRTLRAAAPARPANAPPSPAPGGPPRRPASPWPAPRSSPAGSSRCSTPGATAGGSRAVSPFPPGSRPPAWCSPSPRLPPSRDRPPRPAPR